MNNIVIPKEDLEHIERLAKKWAFKFRDDLCWDEFYSAGLEAYWKYRDSKWRWLSVSQAMTQEWGYWVSGIKAHRITNRKFKKWKSLDRKNKTPFGETDETLADSLADNNVNVEKTVMLREMIQQLTNSIDERKMRIWSALAAHGEKTKAYHEEIKDIGKNKLTYARKLLREKAEEIMA